MRTLLAAAALVTLAAEAHAETFDYASLPESGITLAPKRAARPDIIPAGEHIPGIFVVSPPANEYGGEVTGLSQAYLFSSQLQADQAFGRSVVTNVLSRLAGAHQEPQGCFAIHEYYSEYDDQPNWPIRFQRQGNVQGALKGSKAAKLYSYYSGLQAVRYETVAVSGDTATLSAVDGWVDAVTRGSRAIKTSTMTFKAVADGPGGVKVFAARDPNGETVHFLIRRDSDERVFSNTWTLQAGVESGHSDCGHAHISLRAVPGMGETGSARLDVMLAATPIDANDSAPPAPGQPQMKEIRTRPLKVNLSVSRGAADDKPLPTVSFGWDAAEQRMQSFL